MSTEVDEKKVEETDDKKTTTETHTESGKPEVKEVKETVEQK